MKLNPGEIHIWSTIIDERYAKFLSNSFLSVNEKKHAARFTNDIDAFLYSVRHNLLRIILSNYLDCDPLKIKFNSNYYQKLHVAYPNTNIRYNISSSSNRFVAAFCQYNIIGIDIELIRHIEDISQLSKDYFTDQESTWINSQSKSMIDAAFFEICSKKESLFKAIGKSLNSELNTIDVLSDKPIVYGVNEWHISALKLFDDCAGAIAHNSTNTKFSFYDTGILLK
jgi:4'-phosphopantetheinyl transferase